MGTIINKLPGHWIRNQKPLGSIFRLDLSEEKIDLTFTWMLRNGPPIIRGVDGPPEMEIIDKPGNFTTDPNEQRRFTSFVTNKAKMDALRDWSGDTEHFSEMEWKRHLGSLEEHMEFFDGLEKRAIQGAGDLTMNDHNVAYLKSDLSRNEAMLIHLWGEPIHERIYTCLVRTNQNNHSIRRVRFQRLPIPRTIPVDGDGEYAPQKEGEEIVLALYGKLVVEDGKFRPYEHHIDEFADLRHVFQFPNLNMQIERNGDSNSPLNLPGLSPRMKSAFDIHPRPFFGRQAEYDVWLGEGQLSADPNLRRAACRGPVLINLNFEGLSAPVEVVKEILKEEGYEKKEILNENGEWKYIGKRTDRPGVWIEIYFRENGFPCSMIGVSKAGNVYLLAFNNGYGQGGRTIRDVAQDFLDITADAGDPLDRALLIDEGTDVFQMLRNDKGNLKTVVPHDPSKFRGQVRCCVMVTADPDSGEE